MRHRTEDLPKLRLTDKVVEKLMARSHDRMKYQQRELEAIEKKQKKAPPDRQSVAKTLKRLGEDDVRRRRQNQERQQSEPRTQKQQSRKLTPREEEALINKLWSQSLLSLRQKEALVATTLKKQRGTPHRLDREAEQYLITRLAEVNVAEMRERRSRLIEEAIAKV